MKPPRSFVGSTLNMRQGHGLFMALPRGIFPRDQQAQYGGLRKLAERTAPIDYHRGAPPARWLAWAKQYNIPIPAGLEAEIIKI